MNRGVLDRQSDNRASHRESEAGGDPGLEADEPAEKRVDNPGGGSQVGPGRSAGMSDGPAPFETAAEGDGRIGAEIKIGEMDDFESGAPEFLSQGALIVAAGAVMRFVVRTTEPFQSTVGDEAIASGTENAAGFPEDGRVVGDVFVVEDVEERNEVERFRPVGEPPDVCLNQPGQIPLPAKNQGVGGQIASEGPAVIGEPSEIDARPASGVEQSARRGRRGGETTVENPEHQRPAGPEPPMRFLELVVTPVFLTLHGLDSITGSANLVDGTDRPNRGRRFAKRADRRPVFGIRGVGSDEDAADRPAVTRKADGARFDPGR
jgi:hypothetical protein